MTALTVPIPVLKYPEVPPGLAVLEKPVEIQSAAITFPDGAGFGPEDLNPPGVAGFFVYHRPAAGLSEIWNTAVRQWEPDPALTPGALKPQALIFKAGEALPWQALLVAAGQKDKDGNDQFRKSSAGLLFPQYFVRTCFSCHRNGVTFAGLSPPSPPVCFTGLMDAMRTGILLAEGQTPENATEATFFLRDDSRRIIGSVRITSEAGSARIEMANAAAGVPQAVIRCRADGGVEVQAAAGKTIKLGSPLDVEQIFHDQAAIRFQPDGSLAIQPAPGQTVKLTGSLEVGEILQDQAAIRFLADGSVQIQPAPGKSINLAGNLEVGQIHYQPTDTFNQPSGPKRWLG